MDSSRPRSAWRAARSPAWMVAARVAPPWGLQPSREALVVSAVPWSGEPAHPSRLGHALGSALLELERHRLSECVRRSVAVDAVGEDREPHLQAAALLEQFLSSAREP